MLFVNKKAVIYSLFAIFKTIGYNNKNDSFKINESTYSPELESSYLFRGEQWKK